ncbi:MAG: PorV/PorQ family protein [Ignavibacteria bacterium]|nr:PorV/PorQ family protein [Ignavibacteria bacterium]
MRVIKLIICFIVLSVSAQHLKAQNDGPGNTGLAFLKLGAGARAISMGEAFSSVTDDATAFIYNPSRFSVGDKSNVIIMHNELVQDVNTDFLALKFPLSSKVALGVGVFSTSISNLEIRNIPGAAIETFDASNLSTGLSFSYRINKNFNLGITGKYLFEKIYVDEASGFAFDFGTSYIKDNLSVALVLVNIGSVNALLYEETKLPSALRFGGSYKFEKEKFSFLLGLDGFTVLDGGSFHINTGAEAGYKDFIFLRMGYQTEYENKNFTTGIGFKYKGVYFDYAFVPYSSNFGNSNTFSLGMNF